jgi:hypothetical protein
MRVLRCRNAAVLGCVVVALAAGRDAAAQVLPEAPISVAGGHLVFGAEVSGTYTIVGWYEGEARVTRSVVVPASGWAEVDLVAQ